MAHMGNDRTSGRLQPAVLELNDNLLTQLRFIRQIYSTLNANEMIV